jgi:hypothetical protein
MIVEPIIPPPKKQFTLPEEDMPLTCVLRKVIGGRVEEFIPRLAQIWNTTDAETHFRTACSLDPVGHAEMQAVNFYDHNQEWTPKFRFIEVSKKSCYLCHQFLIAHPGRYCVSSCHQKLYPSSIPPPATESKVYKRCKTITTDLIRCNAQTVPADSTAGVSLSGLTEIGSQVIVRGRVDPVMSGDLAMYTVPQSPSHPIEVASLTPTNLKMDIAVPSESRFPDSTGLPSENGPPGSISAMASHFTRSSDASKQDIIKVSDVFDCSTNYPSWAKLVEFLKIDDGFGIDFKGSREFLVINNQIRVTNERQFVASVQYLHNAGILNAEAFFCTMDEVAIPKFAPCRGD